MHPGPCVLQSCACGLAKLAGAGSLKFRLHPRAITFFAASIALFATFLWSFWISCASSPGFSGNAHTRLQHTWAKHLSHVTFVIGADDRHCHKNPIVTAIVGTKRFRKVVHRTETLGLPTWKDFWLLQPISNHPKKENLTVSTVAFSTACAETFLDHPHTFMTPAAYGSLCSLPF